MTTHSIMIKAVDSDVVVIAITNFHQMVPLNKLWIHNYSPNTWKFRVR